MSLKIISILSLALALALMTTGNAAFANDGHAADPKKQEMMKKFMEYSTPGEEHKQLAAQVGKWSYVSKWWEPGSDKAEESKGTSTFKMIFGGRFLQQEIKGMAMGMKFEGLGITGYNNLTKKYETLWLDSMATGIMHGSGKYDADEKVFKDSGEFTCPMSEKSDKQREYRSEWKMVDKNNSLFTMYTKTNDGKEMKSMEITYKRVK